MGYHFKRDETVPDAIKRIARDELEFAGDRLRRAHDGNRDDAIHEARKSVKKTRALLRLIKPELGDQYREESRVLRNLGGKLSQLRDAGATIEIFDTLKKHYPDELPQRKAASIRKALVTRKRRAEGADVPRILLGIAKSLKAASNRVKEWGIQADGFALIAPGFEKTFRDGRAAFTRALKRRRPEDYHEWRKRLKDHWYHIRLLEGLWTDPLRGYEEGLKNLETWLGDDHNLVLLHDLLVAEPDFGATRKDIDLLPGMIDRFQKELRDNAESFGRRIYEEKPRDFIRRMRKRWKEWKAQPKTVEKFEKQRTDR